MKRLSAMGAYRLSNYLLYMGETEMLSAYPSLFTAEATNEQIAEIEGAYLATLLGENSSVGDLVRRLNPTTDSGRAALVVIELALLYYLNPQVGEVYRYICPQATSGATLSLAAMILVEEGDMLEHFSVFIEAYRKLEYILIPKEYSTEKLHAMLQVDERLLDYLSGQNHVEQIGEAFVCLYHCKASNKKVIKDDKDEKEEEKIEKKVENREWEENKIIFQKNLLEETQRELQMAQTEYAAGKAEALPIIVCTGEAGSGRHFFMEQIADWYQKDILFVKAAYLYDMKHVVNNLKKLLRELAFSDMFLCITDITQNEHTESLFAIVSEEYHKFCQAMAKNDGLMLTDSGRLNTAKGVMSTTNPLLCIGSKEVRCVPYVKQTVIDVRIPLPDMELSRQIWEYFAGLLSLENIDARKLASKMRLTPGQIERILKRFALSGEGKEKLLYKYCYELLDDGRYDGIRRIECEERIEDLMLEEDQKQLLYDICHQAEYRMQVMEDWGMRKRFSYGTGVTALFAGPPGTGKTMAARVLSGMLGLEIFKVDLSQVVDKYIGETEKRLEDIFRKAEQSNMILFFDEADALLGKRSDVKDSKDKYANTEVSFLLQRMEEYDGIVILASNYLQNIDPAFMRRMRFVVHFHLPNEQMRESLWRGAFPDTVPQESIDYEYLAKQFAFSGGQIKNVALNAVFLAAGDKSPLTMTHLIKALYLELTKESQVAFQQALGQYAFLLKA